MSAKEDLRIDEDALDREWLSQPELYLEYGEKLADAKEAEGNLKLAVERERAVAYLDISKNPVSYGLNEKPTKDAILATVSGLEEVQEVENDYNEAKKISSRLNSAVLAFEQRKSSLTKLTDLYLAGYYSEPKSKMRSTTTNTFKDNRKDRVSDKVGNGLNQKRKR